MAETLTIRTASSTEVVKIAVPGPQGPKGDKGDPGDVAGLPLTTQGDTLYRGASQNERLPIGTSGQVLKVSAGGIPEWGAAQSGVSSWNDLTDKPSTFPPSTHTHTASDVTDFNAAAAAAAPVQSVNGNTGAVTVSVPSASSATPQALGVAAAGTSTDFSRADHVHAMPSAADVGAAPASGIDPTAISGTAVVDSDARLSDSRTPSSHASSHAVAGSDPLFDQNLNTTDNAFFNNLETESNVIVGGDLTIGNALVVGSNGLSLQNSPTETTDLTTLATGVRSVSLPDASGTLALVGDAPASHTHGNITNAGLVGTTANLPLKTGTGGIVEAGVFGTGAGEFAEGNHTHTQLHDRSHAITSTSDHTAGNHKVFYSDGSGQIQELALGNSGEVLTSNGATSAPSFAAASGGVSAIGTSAADILSVSGSDLVADDPNADRLVMYDDSASKLTHATAGKGLSFDGTTLNSATAFPVDPISRGATYISYIGGQASSGNSSSAVNTGGGYVIFAPVYIRKSGNYTTFSCIVSTAGSASSLGKMALYTIDPTDATPDALVCESGTFATDSTGIKQPTMTSTFVNEGWYYMALGTNSTTNMAFYGDAMGPLRSVFSGAALNTAALLLDYSQKLYADFWPNPWDGTGTTFRNAFHPITSLT